MTEVAVSFEVIRFPAVKIYKTTIESVYHKIKWEIGDDTFLTILALLAIIRSIPHKIATALKLQQQDLDGSFDLVMLRKDLLHHQKEIWSTTPYYQPPPRHMELHWIKFSTNLLRPLEPYDGENSSKPFGLFDNVGMIITRMENLFISINNKEIDKFPIIIKDLFNILDMVHWYAQCVVHFIHPICMEALNGKKFELDKINIRSSAVQEYLHTLPSLETTDAGITQKLALALASTTDTKSWK
jgi:hypothetical protein